MQSTLVGLWLVPAIVSVRFYFWRFVLVSGLCSAAAGLPSLCAQRAGPAQVWLTYSGVTGWMLYLCSARKRIAPTTPRRVGSDWLVTYMPTLAFSGCT